MHSDELWSNNDYRYYLAHHGVLGQKWGQRNGPPYPLGSDISTGKRLRESAGAAIKKGKAAIGKAVETHKQKVAERKEEKEKQKIKKAVASSEVEKIEKIKDKLSTQEFEDAVKRAELNKRLLNADTRKSKLEKFTNVLNTFTTVTGAGVGAWNNFARITNTFLDTDLPVIGKTGRENKKKKDEDDKPKDKKPQNPPKPAEDKKPDKSSSKKSNSNSNSKSNKKTSNNTNNSNRKTNTSTNNSNKKKSSSDRFKNAREFAKDFSKVVWPEDKGWNSSNSWVDDFVKSHPEDFNTPVSLLLEDKRRAKHSDELLEDYLVHHGIRGQKWGQRNGPPYPLDSSISTGKTLRSAINYGGKMTKEERIKKRQEKAEADFKKKQSEDYSDNKKQISKFLATVALDAAAGNPFGIAADVVRAGQAVNASVKNKKYEKERALEEEDKKTGFKLKSNELSEKEDLARVNPSFYNFDSNTKSNCMLCTTTYDLRRRGYDVTAKTAGVGFFPPDVKKWYPKADLKTLSGEYTGKVNGIIGDRIRAKDATSKFVSEVLFQGEGARGNIMVTWAGLQGGHSMIYEVTNGSVRILDGQSNKIYSDPSKILYKTTGVFDYARLDNVDFDSEAVKRCCK